jgi:ribonuclease P protein subunit POP4
MASFDSDLLSGKKGSVMRNPSNILRHEFIGLACEIVGSKNKSHVGISGKIVDETMKTIVIDVQGRRKVVEKKGATFRVMLGGKRVEIDGNYIVSRPEDRIKKKIQKW